MNDTELKDLSTSNVDKALAALEAGDIARAKECILGMEKEAKTIHDFAYDFVGALLTYIGRTYGDDEVVKAMRFRHGVQDQVAEKMLGMSPEDAVRYKTMLHRGHHSTMTLTEEPTRYVLKLSPCGTGGRMLLERPTLGRTTKALPESWGQTGVPYYCAHCAVNSLISVEKGAPHPTWVIERPKSATDACHQYCYKTTGDVPKEAYAQFGLNKHQRPAKEIARTSEERVTPNPNQKDVT